MQSISSYLAGESFSDDLAFRPCIIHEDLPRGDWLERIVAQKRILHVGFADHVPLIERRVADGSWLHARLTQAAKVCMGIDINEQAVLVARAQGFDNVQVLDVFSPQAPHLLQQEDYELVLVPDVIEHLHNPVEFLKRLTQCLPDAQFVVSVPNALSFRNAQNLLRGVERVNTDHRAWFSPFTLLKVMVDAGLAVSELHGCQVASPGSLRGRVLQAAVKWRPMGSDVLIACANFHKA
jgi:hypothetical protein